MAKLKLPVGSGNTGKEKAVKKAGGSNAVDPGIKVSDKYEAQERKYRAQSDARALAEAEEIRKDKERMRGVKSHVKMMNKACE